MQSKIRIRGKKVLMIGAGGAARAIGLGVIREKGKLIILNRTTAKARRLAKELKCGWGPLEEIRLHKEVDIIINATSIGMFPDAHTPIGKQTLRKIITEHTVVFDTVYNPKKTKLLKEAEELGCNTVGGYDMFLNQAKLQLGLFLGG